VFSKTAGVFVMSTTFDPSAFITHTSLSTFDSLAAEASTLVGWTHPKNDLIALWRKHWVNAYRMALAVVDDLLFAVTGRIR
jgi:hypothetical protein